MPYTHTNMHTCNAHAHAPTHTHTHTHTHTYIHSKFLQMNKHHHANTFNTTARQISNICFQSSTDADRFKKQSTQSTQQISLFSLQTATRMIRDDTLENLNQQGIIKPQRRVCSLHKLSRHSPDFLAAPLSASPPHPSVSQCQTWRP